MTRIRVTNCARDASGRYTATVQHGGVENEVSFYSRPCETEAEIAHRAAEAYAALWGAAVAAARGATRH